ncbi:monocarboxylate transporter 13-like [Acanthaster planci]|uniref:Monocarboxylate transporter 13-like n=1 Tax=Acanthaster planci TaxID=133434 RepID=A0A8B7Y7L3_ACAPL|nr:monocarboxylate transporter 13-like [Acanthaster planci]
MASRYWKYIIAVAVFMQYLVSLGPLYNYSVFLGPLQTEFKTSAVLTGWVGSLAAAMLGTMSPFTAILSWKIGNVRVVFLGVILSAAGYLSTSFISSLPQAYLTFGLLTGVGAGFMVCGSASVLMDWYLGQGGACRSTGGAMIGSSAGVMVVGPLANSFTASHGWRSTFRFLSGVTLGLGLVTALPFLKAAEDPASDQDCTNPKPEVPVESGAPDQGQVADDQARSGSDLTGDVPSRVGSLKSFCEKVLNVEVWLWVSSITTAQLGWTFAIINFSSFMEGIGLSTERISVALTASGAGEILGKLTVAVFGDRLPCLKLYVVVVSSVGGAVISGLFTVFSAFWSTVVLAVVWGFCRGGVHGVCFAAAGELFQNYSPRAVVAIAVLGFGTGVLIGSPLTGVFYDLTGDYTLSLFVVVASFVASVVCALLIPLKRALMSRVLCRRRPADDASSQTRGNNANKDEDTRAPPTEENVRYRSVGASNMAYEIESKI